MADLPTYLTETILTIQNEVQLALDYIETVSRQQSSQLGAAPSLITVDNLRIRIPLLFEMEQEDKPIEVEKERPLPWTRLTASQLASLKGQLQLRQGLLLKTQAGQVGSFTKIKVTSVKTPVEPAATADNIATEPTTATPLTGEIELNFIRTPRELAETAAAAETTTATHGSAVPDLAGLTLDEATARLNSEKWAFKAHAASQQEVAAITKERQGRIIRQDPAADLLVDKTGVILHFWVALSNIPVQEIDGIGEKIGARLAGIGIATIGQLSLAKAADIAVALRISEPRMQSFIDMAALMCRLIVIGMRDEVTELLVKGVSIRSIEQLADAEPAQLLKQCQEAISSGRVRVPRGFSFNIGNVTSWIKAARSYLQ